MISRECSVRLVNYLKQYQCTMSREQLIDFFLDRIATDFNYCSKITTGELIKAAKEAGITVKGLTQFKIHQYKLVGEIAEKAEAIKQRTTKTKTIDITADEIMEMKKNHTISELARLLNIDRKTIYNKLNHKKHYVPPRLIPVDAAEKIKDLYMNEKMTIKEISKIYGVHQGTMGKFMKENNIKARNKSEAKTLQRREEIEKRKDNRPV